MAAIHPYAKHPLKEWGKQRFETLAEILVQNGFSALFIDEGTAADGIFFTGRVSLETLVGILAKVSLFFGNDSGPTHIAAALGTPTVAIFGPTHPCLGFVPRGKYATYLHSGIKCSPCTLHGEGKCRFGSPKCFEQIAPESVAEAGLKIYTQFTAQRQKH